MALNLSFLNKLVSSAPISPKVAGSTTTGYIAVIVLDLIHSIAPTVTLPSTTTMIAIVSFAMGAVGYLLPHSGTPSKSAVAAPPVAAPAAPPVNPPPAAGG